MTRTSRTVRYGVKSGHCGKSASCPLYPQKRTSEMAYLLRSSGSLAMFAAIRRASLKNQWSATGNGSRASAASEHGQFARKASTATGLKSS
jgi:hypothetical protein